VHIGESVSKTTDSTLRIQYLQHVPFEKPAGIATWARHRGHTITGCRLDRDEPLPALDAFDWLVIMGGPMSVHDEAIYPWLADEKKLIERALKARKRVMGICLGAQLLADVLAAKVYPNRHKEIGWFPVHLTPQANASGLFADFPASIPAFHWHGETFEIPSGARHLARNQACENQAFEFGGTALAVQFHLEVTPSIIQALIKNCRADFGSGRYQQPPDQILARRKEFGMIRRLLHRMLDRLAGLGSSRPPA
jgi:GMP synthase-like glutamine amidotransferase